MTVTFIYMHVRLGHFLRITSLLITVVDVQLHVLFTLHDYADRMSR